MGADKATLLLHGTPLVKRAVDLLRTVFQDVRIVGSRPDLALYAPVVPDFRAGCGPLSGIEAALSVTEEYAVFLPVDLPALPADFLRLMAARVARTNAVCTIPQYQGVVQPLCAVYHRSLLPAVTQSLDAGDYKVLRVVEQGARAIQFWGAIDRFDLEAVLTVEDSTVWSARTHDIFLNCNTAAEFSRISRHLRLPTQQVEY